MAASLPGSSKGGKRKVIRLEACRCGTIMRQNAKGFLFIKGVQGHVGSS